MSCKIVSVTVAPVVINSNGPTYNFPVFIYKLLVKPVVVSLSKIDETLIKDVDIKSETFSDEKLP